MHNAEGLKHIVHVNAPQRSIRALLLAVRLVEDNRESGNLSLLASSGRFRLDYGDLHEVVFGIGQALLFSGLARIYSKNLSIPTEGCEARICSQRLIHATTAPLKSGSVSNVR